MAPDDGSAVDGSQSYAHTSRCLRFRIQTSLYALASAPAVQSGAQPGAFGANAPPPPSQLRGAHLGSEKGPSWICGALLGPSVDLRGPLLV